jgi:prolyl-tRNA editing enzyme YbaK/EbsC (Cys-tRNA(Pro) deacylase)
MSMELPRSARRVLEAAAKLGLDPEIVEMPESTRTAQEAAAACGCGVGQIVKSLLFRGASGKPYLLLVSGANRVDEGKAAIEIGEALRRPDADYVRETTGFAIGGIPPFGHDVPLAPYMDVALLGFGSVWAAAGTPRTVMRLDPARLRDATNARVIPVC